MASIPVKKYVEIDVLRNDMNPVMLESPHKKWVFIRKVYSILAIQSILAIAVALIVNFIPFLKELIFATEQTKTGTALYIVLNILPLFVLLLLYFCRRKYPFNVLLLMVFTFALAFMVGSNCATGHGKMILQVVILMAVVIVSLILYTFLAAKKGFEFRFLGPFFFAATLMVIAFFVVQIIFPLGMGAWTFFGLVVGIGFCAYVLYATNIIIKHLSYDEYVWASARVHVDIIPIIISFLTCKRAGYR